MWGRPQGLPLIFPLIAILTVCLVASSGPGAPISDYTAVEAALHVSGPIAVLEGARENPHIAYNLGTHPSGFKRTQFGGHPLSSCRTVQATPGQNCLIESSSGLAANLSNASVGRWLQLTGVGGPGAAASWGQVAYDSADGYVLLVDSFLTNGAWTTETWALLSSGWTELNTTRPPSYGAQSGPFYLVDDPADGYVLYLGGGTYGTSPGNETWTYVNRTWTEIFPQGSPPPVNSSLGKFGSITYDAASGYAVLFTGSETWTFRGGEWTEMATATQPPVPTHGDSIAYDPPCGCVLLEEENGSRTWVFNSGNWSEIYPVDAGPALGPQAPIMVYDSYFTAVALLTSSGQFWTFFQGNWTRIDISVPGANGVAFGTFDAGTGGILLYLSYNLSQGHVVVLNQTWSFGAGEVSLSSTPVRGGAVTLNGSSLLGVTYTKSTVVVGFGNYSVSAAAEPWTRFSRWVSSGNGSLQVKQTNASRSTALLTVLGNGSVTADFNPAPFVHLAVDPAACEPVVFGGQSYSNGSDPEFLQGTYSASASCSGYYFYRWQGSSNVSIANPGNASTSILLNGGNGTLEAVFAIRVTMVVNGPSFGRVMLNGTVFPNGATWLLPVENYSLQTIPEPWGEYSHWSVFGVGVQFGTQALWVKGPGDTTIEAHFGLLPEISLSGNLPSTTDTSCRSFSLDNSTVSNDSWVHLSLGTHWIQVGALCRYTGVSQFEVWEGSKNITLSNPGNSSTKLEIVGNGTLEAIFQTVYGVVFKLEGDPGGTIRLGNHVVSPTSSELLPGGSYNLSATPESGYFFGAWIVSGSVEVLNGTLLVAGPGSVTADFGKSGPPPSGNVTPPSNSTGIELIGGLLTAGAALATLILYRGRRRIKKQDDGSEHGSVASPPDEEEFRKRKLSLSQTA